MRQERRTGMVECAGLVAACLAVCALHWCKLETLAYGDNVRWFLEVYRSANGEQVYRDFAFMYAPFGLWVASAALHAFGSTFAVLQVTIDILSVVLCLLVWRVAARVLPRGLALAVAILTILGGAANPGNFALFSLSLYTPSLLTGVVGVLLFALPILDRAADDASPASGMNAAGLGLLAAGGAIAVLSKIEFAVGIAAASVASTMIEWARRGGSAQARRWYLALWSLSFMPAALVYAWLWASVGHGLVGEAISGYGVGKQVCPWWPTGVGLLSAGGAVGEAVLVVAAVSVPFASTLAPRHRRHLPAAVAVVIAAAVVVVVAAPYALVDFRSMQPTPAVTTLKTEAVLAVSYALSFNGVLLPVMWVGIVFLARDLVRWALARSEERGRAVTAPLLFVVIAMATGISLRGLFSGLFTDTSTVNQSAYPFWFIVAAWFIDRGVRYLVGPSSRDPARWAAIAGIFVLVGYGSLRLAYRVQQMHAGGPYETFATEAGPVRLHGDAEGRALYGWLVSSTPPDARVLEIPWGGGLTFASHRRSSLYSTQFFGLAPSPGIQSIDHERMETAPPDVVVAADRPDFGISAGLGRGCALPRISFRSPRVDRPPLAIADEVARRYHEVMSAGGYVVLAPGEAR